LYLSPPDIEREAAIKTFELPERQVGEFTDFEKQTVDSVRKEIVALKMLKHNNIVRLYDVKKLNNIIFMIMELCDGGVPKIAYQ
jgi:serine/threonine-protein kinase ULK/ATG1